MDQGLVFAPGGSQGNLCLSGDIVRYAMMPLFSGTTGEFFATLDVTNTPTPFGPVGTLSGETCNFQVWHRDANPMPTSNFTDARSITFE